MSRKPIAFIITVASLIFCAHTCSGITHDYRVTPDTHIKSASTSGGIDHMQGAYDAGPGVSDGPCVQNPPPGSPVNFYAARCMTALATTDPVSTWTDYGSGGSDLTAAGTARPTYTDPCDTLADGGALINGEPCMAFNGTSNVMTTMSAGGTEPWTLCYFVRGHSTAARYALGQTVGGNPHYMIIAAQATNTAYRFQGKDAAASRNIDTPSTYVTDRFTYGCYSFYGGTTNPVHCTDETNEANPGCNTATQPSVSYSIDNWSYVAVGANFGATFANVDWIELGYWEEDITTAQWETYLESIYGALPSDS